MPTVADAPRRQLGGPLAPAATRPYLRLSRADRPDRHLASADPLPLGHRPGRRADPDGFRPLGPLARRQSCAVGAFLMRGAGCTWNDITDRDIDAAVARTRSRPLPSGQVTPRQALVWMVVQSLLAAGILFTYNRAAIALGVASLAWWRSIPLPSASPGGRRCSWASPSTGARCWPGPPMPAASRCAAVLLYAAGIAWTLFYDTIYAHQDHEDDALIGVKSTARLFGDNTRPWLRGFLWCRVAADGCGGPRGAAADRQPAATGARPRRGLGLRLAHGLATCAGSTPTTPQLPAALPLQPRRRADPCAVSCRRGFP